MRVGKDARGRLGAVIRFCGSICGLVGPGFPLCPRAPFGAPRRFNVRDASAGAKSDSSFNKSCGVFSTGAASSAASLWGPSCFSSRPPSSSLWCGLFTVHGGSPFSWLSRIAAATGTAAASRWCLRAKQLVIVIDVAAVRVAAAETRPSDVRDSACGAAVGGHTFIQTALIETVLSAPLALKATGPHQRPHTARRSLSKSSHRSQQPPQARRLVWPRYPSLFKNPANRPPAAARGDATHFRNSAAFDPPRRRCAHRSPLHSQRYAPAHKARRGPAENKKKVEWPPSPSSTPRAEEVPARARRSSSPRNALRLAKVAERGLGDKTISMALVPPRALLPDDEAHAQGSNIVESTADLAGFDELKDDDKGAVEK